MAFSSGFWALVATYAAVLLFFIPVILLRRLWNSRQDQPENTTRSGEEEVHLLLPKYFLPLLATLIGTMFIMFWALWLTTFTPDSGEYWRVLTTGGAVSLPWLLALVYSWKKGTFDHEQP